ncbi:MAG: hydrogenase nickel incorporation protein HypB [Candidatus Delongbacteria bacterium]
MHLVHVEHKLREHVDEAGGRNREEFRAARLHVINLMSAPGAGKTSLLERTLERAAGRWRLAVIEGDIQGDADADRLARFGVPVRQIHTHGACHLDPDQVAVAATTLNLAELDILFIENVGNLVCPAEFDLGEEDRVMLLSVPEGHDKPAKYPLMFSTADLLLLNKWDLLPMTDFDPAEARRAAMALNPGLETLEISCRDGRGLDDWLDWLERRHRHSLEHWNGHAHSHAEL